MTDTRQEADNITPPRQLTNSSVANGGNYIPTWTDTRPGSQDHEDVPSRRVETREWRDGRVERAA
jgi:hypothetical protein